MKFQTRFCLDSKGSLDLDRRLLKVTGSLVFPCFPMFSQANQRGKTEAILEGTGTETTGSGSVSDSSTTDTTDTTSGGIMADRRVEICAFRTWFLGLKWRQSDNLKPSISAVSFATWLKLGRFEDLHQRLLRLTQSFSFWHGAFSKRSQDGTDSSVMVSANLLAICIFLGLWQGIPGSCRLGRNIGCKIGWVWRLWPWSLSVSGVEKWEEKLYSRCFIDGSFKCSKNHSFDVFLRRFLDVLWMSSFLTRTSTRLPKLCFQNPPASHRRFNPSVVRDCRPHYWCLNV